MDSVNTAAILEFWFGAAAESPAEVRTAKKYWYRSGPRLDKEIIQRFSNDHIEAQRPHTIDVQGDARDLLARILLLDQFSRHLYRGTAKAYAFDPMAQDFAQRLHWPRLDLSCSPIEKVFALHPFHHAENPQLQRMGIEQLEQIKKKSDNAWQGVLKRFLKSFEDHALIIDRFGRFPHRNSILGRTQTNAEIKFMKTTKQHFGQVHGSH